MTLPPVTIVLSSYNGEKFIAEQIASIRQQTHPDWKLLVRDDGSSDHTRDIVQALIEVDDRIMLLRDHRGNLGPAASFGVLLEYALNHGAGYVALADQDDVWSPTKIARELEVMLRQEDRSGESEPILVHTDLTVVREDLRLIHQSFLAYQGLRHLADSPLGTLLIQNFVTGCTTLINRPLLQLAVPLPSVIMHDWWLALCAAALGEICYLPEATVLYRQHRMNALGSPGQRKALWRSLRKPVDAWLQAGVVLEQALEQARELTKRVEREGPGSAAAFASLSVLRDFCRAFSEGDGLTRLRVLSRHNIRPRTFLPYPVRFYARVLLWSRTSYSPAGRASAGGSP
ncbi:MAG TPA: glycosyltransferase family 2 protein [Gemmatimonadales bacterium]|nr:glycosyltransferase family 2 protein [Gemmatimonadales bacterium]